MVIKKKSKENQKEANLSSYFKGVYDIGTFSQKHSMKNLGIFTFINFIILVLLVTINFGISTQLEGSGGIFTLENLLLVLVGLPLILGLSYIVFYIFLNAFESNRKNFFESLLVYCSIILPFMIISHILTLISQAFNNNFILTIFTSLTILIGIVMILNFVLSFKAYYKTNGFKIIASLILVQICFGLIILISFVTILMSKQI